MGPETRALVTGIGLGASVTLASVPSCREEAAVLVACLCLLLLAGDMMRGDGH